MHRRSLSLVAGAAGVAVSLAVAMGAPAQARTVAPSATGTCSGGSHITLHASQKKQTIKVTAKVKTHVKGETWDWLLSDNTVPVSTGENATGKNGKLVVRQTIPNEDGPDTVDFTAVDTVTGETCTAEVVVQ